MQRVTHHWNAMKQLGGRLVLAALAAVDTVVLCRLVPPFGQLAHDVQAPHAWVATAGADHAASTAAAALVWLVALWLALGLLASLSAAFLGRENGLLDTCARRITPALMRKLIGASVGASIALAPAVAAAAPGYMTLSAPAPASSLIGAGTGSPTGTAVTGRLPDLPPPSWPLDAGGSTSEPSRPSDGSHGPTSSGTNPTPPAVVAAPALPLDPEPNTPTTGSVVVKPGDSLWLLTAQRLGPSATEEQIAVGWPYWYRANRRVIGRDPNLLRPGEQLTAPFGGGS